MSEYGQIMSGIENAGPSPEELYGWPILEGPMSVTHSSLILLSTIGLSYSDGNELGKYWIKECDEGCGGECSDEVVAHINTYEYCGH